MPLPVTVQVGSLQQQLARARGGDHLLGSPASLGGPSPFALKSHLCITPGPAAAAEEDDEDSDTDGTEPLWNPSEPPPDPLWTPVISDAMKSINDNQHA